MFPRARARSCALGAQKKRAPRTLRLEVLEIRNYLSASPSNVFATPQVSIIPSVTTAISGYTPAQIANAYGFNQIRFGNTVGNGAGQTIAIVDAYDNPSIASNLATFNRQFGLPDSPFTKVNQTGGTKFPAASASWSTEIALDAEWAHAMAPGASILLVEANSASLSDLLTAVNYARSQPGVSVVSMSWGASEFGSEQPLDAYFTTPAGHSGVTFVASSGDGGAGANWPAVSPNVVAVGGTSLTITSAGAYSSETAWSGSGGGKSAIYSTPTYQLGVQSTGHRTLPDVSFDANPSTGFAVYNTAGGSKGWMVVGGTSAGAPQWAALIAIADQGRAISKLTPLSGTDTNLYKLPAADFHDITKGSNGGFSATVGYDEVTGRGSPYANLVARDLVGATATTVVTVTSIFMGPRVILWGNAIEGSHTETDATLAVAEFVRTSQSVIVGTTSVATSTSSPVVTIYQVVTGYGIAPIAGSAGVIDEAESLIETTTVSTTTADSETSLDETADGTTTTTTDPSVHVESDAALPIEEVETLEFSAPVLEVEAHATLGARVSAVDACFAEGDLAAVEFIEADAVPAESVSEHSATTGLAMLAGVIIGGWQPVASAARPTGLVNRGSASASTDHSNRDDEGFDE